MSGDIQYGRCDVCGKDASLARKYYYYGLKCECHSPGHFEMVNHCNDCTPKPPLTTKITLAIPPVDDVRPEGLIDAASRLIGEEQA